MTNPSSPAAHQSFSPFFQGVLAWFVVTLFSPVLQWLAGIFGVPGPVPSVSTWMRFVAVMAVFGAVAGAVTFLAERSGNRWARSFAFALVIALAVSRIDEFAREPLQDFILTSVGVSLSMALLAGSIFYVLGFLKR